jgi:hypothetical protein
MTRRLARTTTKTSDPLAQRVENAIAAERQAEAALHAAKQERIEAMAAMTAHSQKLADAADPVGLIEIADRLGVRRQTADMWRTRGVLPEPRWVVGGRPAWDWTTDIVPWAKETSRIP